ncbi:2TM domain-containing protein [Geojedonia litorea]|uniref:2TM domain-containing protein n=1 Tax=Geojedonia litorea TaxID=1268269 RepID=A0ABV9N377_9FLAO
MNRLDKNYNTEYRKEDAYLRAQKRLKELKGFYGHAFWYVIVNLFIIIMVAFNSRGNIWHFGTFSTAFFWGIGLGFHALSVFGRNFFFSKSWEDKKIREYLEKEEEAEKRRFE